MVDIHQLAREVLTQREYLIWERYIAGDPITAIAARSGRSTTTVRNQLASARRKVDAAYALEAPVTIRRLDEDHPEPSRRVATVPRPHRDQPGRH
jgi:DNA-binding NarL/FixJ family response regulator